MKVAIGGTRAGTFAKYLAFGLTVLLAAFGGAFLIGETVMDPGGPVVVASVVCWGVATVALAAYALWRPGPATRTLTVLAIVVAAFIVADLVLRFVPRGLGPAGSACALAVATGLGFLGVRRPAAAGRLLLLVGVAAVGAGGSGVALAGPVLVIAALFLLAGVSSRRTS
ncbi:hypothetical protein [Actinoplanes sp. NPDC049316]|uniref:hypothetical protein n=1 Tax=Actinoplanes sp. NPDC049316 TaxID=3154727 RepID=UPI00341887F5